MSDSISGPLYVAELAPAYQTRPPLVVDCSVIAAAVFGESNRDVALQRLEGYALHAPWLIDVEFSQVALKKSRTDGPQIADAGVIHFAEVVIRRYSVDPASVITLARHYDLSAYDAAYLLVASELRAPLATFDQQLAKAAQKHLGSLQ